MLPTAPAIPVETQASDQEIPQFMIDAINGLSEAPPFVPVNFNEFHVRPVILRPRDITPIPGTNMFPDYETNFVTYVNYQAPTTEYQGILAGYDASIVERHLQHYNYNYTESLKYYNRFQQQQQQQQQQRQQQAYNFDVVNGNLLFFKSL
jgi:hypothetical protein